MINAFAESNFINCRINAYPSVTDYKGVPRYKPNFLFIDLDKKKIILKVIIALNLHYTTL